MTSPVESGGATRTMRRLGRRGHSLTWHHTTRPRTRGWRCVGRWLVRCIHGQPHAHTHTHTHTHAFFFTSRHISDITREVLTRFSTQLDATALFQKHHAWVNVEMLFACCVGTLAKPVVTNGQGRRVKWDEQGIQAHDAQRGVMFGASVPLATLLALQAAPMTCALAPPPGQAP